MFSFFKKIGDTPWLAEVVAALAGVAYFLQSRLYAHAQSSVLDEGSYLIKGYLFATGQYQPFQDYGPWTNHMPLSFLIPGWVQVWFGPGLRTGRYLSILCGLLFLLGLWLLARRFGGRWWAAASVAAITLNPAIIKGFSLAASQSLAAFILIWALAFSLGKERPLWQVLLGSALAGVLFLTRVNLAPVLPLLLLYLLWEHGWRVALWATLAGGGVVLIGHGIYWPGILKLWGTWLPKRLTLFLDAWRIPGDAVYRWNPDVPFSERLESFFRAVRFNFVPVSSFFAALLLWRKPTQWQRPSRHRLAVFLATLFAVLFLMHSLASLGKNYCVYCLQAYVTFFAALGLLFLIVVVREHAREGSRGRTFLIVLFILLITAGVGFASRDLLPLDFIQTRTIQNIIEYQVPKFQLFGLPPGKANLITVLANEFDLNYQETFKLTQRMLRIGVVVGYGLLVGIFVLLLTRLLRSQMARFQPNGGVGYGFAAITIFLIFGLLLSPTVTLGGSTQSYDCFGDVIASYETAGEVLAEAIPPGAQVYWNAGNSAVPLLYIPGVRIYPPQLNDGYSFVIGGDPDEVLKMGHWNDQLQSIWRQEADYLLLDDRVDVSTYVESGDWAYLTGTPPVMACQPTSAIRILGKVTTE